MPFSIIKYDLRESFIEDYENQNPPDINKKIIQKNYKFLLITLIQKGFFLNRKILTELR